MTQNTEQLLGEIQPRRQSRIEALYENMKRFARSSVLGDRGCGYFCCSWCSSRCSRRFWLPKTR